MHPGAVAEPVGLFFHGLCSRRRNRKVGSDFDRQVAREAAAEVRLEEHLAGRREATSERASGHSMGLCGGYYR